MSIVIEQIVSVDGFAADRKNGLDFFASANFDGDDPDDHEQLQFLSEIDRVVLGRHTFEMFSSYWPNVDPSTEAVAEPINRLPKTVVSTTLVEATWGSADRAIGSVEIARSIDDVVARSTVGERIVVWGSLALCEALFDTGAVDRLRLRVVPTLIGDGRGFTRPLGSQPMQLMNVQSQTTGHVTLDYAIVR